MESTRSLADTDLLLDKAVIYYKVIPTMDYQKTLNLPKTNFTMKAGLIQKEPAMLASWEKFGVYQKIREKSQGKTPFILHEG